MAHRACCCCRCCPSSSSAWAASAPAWRPRLRWGSWLPALAASAAAARRRPWLGARVGSRFASSLRMGFLAPRARCRCCCCCPSPPLAWGPRRLPFGVLASGGVLGSPRLLPLSLLPVVVLRLGPRRLLLGVLASGGVLGSPRSLLLLLLLPVAVLGLGLAPASASCPCLWFGSWLPALAAAAVICINKHESSSSE